MISDATLSSLVATVDEWCLFLDVDGTLLEIARAPGDVSVEDSLRDLLQGVGVALGGAVALVSGRSLATLDELFALGGWPAAGVHGAERRDAAGRTHFCGPDGGRLDPARVKLRRVVAELPGAIFEDKVRSLAVHFRGAPEAERTLRRAMEDRAVALAPDYRLLDGKRVIELKPVSANKARAIREFLQEPPFAGRKPVFIGDDTGDLEAFALVEDAGGLSIGVGELPARAHLASPSEVRSFLASIVQASHGPRSGRPSPR